MALMNDATRQKVRQVFESQLSRPVEILLFHPGGSDEYTAATREILSEMVNLSDGRLKVQNLPAAEHTDLAASYQVDKFPALVFLDEAGSDQRLRFYGAPVGYEFMSLLDDIVDVSRGETRLSPAARDQVKAIRQDMVIQVFSTPG